MVPIISTSPTRRSLSSLPNPGPRGNALICHAAACNDTARTNLLLLRDGDESERLKRGERGCERKKASAGRVRGKDGGREGVKVKSRSSRRRRRGIAGRWCHVFRLMAVIAACTRPRPHWHNGPVTLSACMCASSGPSYSSSCCSSLGVKLHDLAAQPIRKWYWQDVPVLHEQLGVHLHA